MQAWGSLVVFGPIEHIRSPSFAYSLRTPLLNQQQHRANTVHPTPLYLTLMYPQTRLGGPRFE
jgi:hypothetical protein